VDIELNDKECGVKGTIVDQLCSLIEKKRDKKEKGFLVDQLCSMIKREETHVLYVPMASTDM
jgi:hypothetical protein